MPLNSTVKMVKVVNFVIYILLQLMFKNLNVYDQRSKENLHGLLPPKPKKMLLNKKQGNKQKIIDTYIRWD
jgi:hypothetical protein